MKTPAHNGVISNVESCEKTKMTYSDDITAIKALKDGDEKAYSWIYNKYVQPLRAYAGKITVSKETAENIVQDLAELKIPLKFVKITASFCENHKFYVIIL